MTKHEKQERETTLPEDCRRLEKLRSKKALIEMEEKLILSRLQAKIDEMKNQ